MFFSEGEFIQFFCDFRRKIAIGFVANYPIEHGASLSGKAEKLLVVCDGKWIVLDHFLHLV